MFSSGWQRVGDDDDDVIKNGMYSPGVGRVKSEVCIEMKEDDGVGVGLLGGVRTSQGVGG